MKNHDYIFSNQKLLSPKIFFSKNIFLQKNLIKIISFINEIFCKKKPLITNFILSRKLFVIK